MGKTIRGRGRTGKTWGHIHCRQSRREWSKKETWKYFIMTYYHLYSLDDQLHYEDSRQGRGSSESHQLSSIIRGNTLKGTNAEKSQVQLGKWFWPYSFIYLHIVIIYFKYLCLFPAGLSQFSGTMLVSIRWQRVISPDITSQVVNKCFRSFNQSIIFRV